MGLFEQKLAREARERGSNLANFEVRINPQMWEHVTWISRFDDPLSALKGHKKGDR